MSNQKAKDHIVNKRSEILKHLKDVVKKNQFSYRTFGTEIEEYVTDKLIEIFTKSGFVKDSKDYQVARHKNEFPDFLLKSTESHLAVEIKCGNHSKISKGKWIKCKNSNNDMGTLNVWREKIDKYGGENIFYLFIEYNFNDKVKEVKKVTIAPFYQFIGLNKFGLLKYREKDGNLRPKDFTSSPPIETLAHFNSLFKKTVIFRSKRIIKKHWKVISNKERKGFVEELKS